ncbi:MAG: KamA family radical SAM protein [Deltaproteobacteria bacterium]|nr:KamA family radical SAM protein [Deltaproteobacteria bacterium]
MDKDILFTDEGEPPGTLSTLGQVDKRTGVVPSKYSISSHSEKGKIVCIGKSQGVSRFQPGPRTLRFRKRFFPQATNAEWNDWHWQLRHRVTRLPELERIIRLSEDERNAILRSSASPPVAITPYFASLLDEEDSLQSLRRTVVPVTAEYERSRGEATDPLGEEGDSPVPWLVHRYPDRVLFLATGFCSTYCRYCTRSRMVGSHRSHHFNLRQWQRAIDYIEATPAVRDVLLSGGDPLTLRDENLEWLLSRLRRIRHVELLRIGTKAPVVLPQRITGTLTRMLRRYHPLWMSIHFTHPDELTPEVRRACESLANAGIPLGSQTVLLAGVNDNAETMRRLFHGLLQMRVRPYYLYQCDPVSGSAHFRTPVQKGMEIIKGLRGHTSGYAVPTYVIDAPGGGGKIPLLPEYVIGRDGSDLLLRNYEGHLYRYPDPDGNLVSERSGKAHAVQQKEGM